MVGDGTVKKTLLPQKASVYPFETVVILEPIPLNSWEFVEWEGVLSGNDVPELLVVDREKYVTAVFQKK